MSSLKLEHGGMTLEKVQSALKNIKNQLDHQSHNENGSKENKVKHEDHQHRHHNHQNGRKATHVPSDPPSAETSAVRDLGNEKNPYTYEILMESARHVLDRIDTRPKIGIICGSGLGALADCLEDKTEFPYGEIPHFPVSTVAGHAGQLVAGQLAQVPVICMQGRFHYYEGYPMWKCAMPVRVLKLMGIEILIVTNAAGGLNPDYKVGDVMILKDHINFPGFAGLHPLRGPNEDRFGTRFPPLNNAYDRKLRTLAKQVASELGMNDFLHEGVYTMLGGPNFETVAELRMLRMLGVDAVGMSTVPEVITAVHSGMRVFSFSLITNEAITEWDAEEEASHEEVVETGQKRQEDLKKFMSYLIPCIQRDEIPRQSRNVSE